VRSCVVDKAYNKDEWSQNSGKDNQLKARIARVRSTASPIETQSTRQRSHGGAVE
jgi:hypothetical protein